MTPNFSELLQQAVNEPGTISSAYSNFHNYSFGNQLLVEARRGLVIGFIVEDQELDLASEDATLLVDVLLAEQIAVARGHALRAVRSALGHCGTDADRLLGLARRCRPNRGNRESQQ